MKNLFVYRLLFDFGLVVLIWMVQLIIYPSFQFYPNSNLLEWHLMYTKSISLIVIPLMLGQLIIVAYQFLKIRNSYTIISYCGVLLVWLLTFLIFVPMHNEIGTGLISETLLQKLVEYNWFRTIIWTLLFLFNILSFKHNKESLV